MALGLSAGGTLKQVLEIVLAASGTGDKDAAAKLDKLKDKGDETQKGMSGLQKTMLGVAGIGFGGVAAGLAASINVAADFEQALANVGAATGSSTEEMKALRQEALNVGRDTSKSASESVEAFGELVKAGVSVQDVIKGVGRTAVQLAASTGIGVADAATILSNSLNTFDKQVQDAFGGDKAKAASAFADTLAKAANASAIDMSDLQFSLQAVGPVAAQAGLTMDDFATTIGIMGNHALKGSDAGTSLKTMLLALEAPTDKARALMDKYGISMFDNQGHTRAFRDVIGDLQKSMTGLSEEERSGVLKDIFGTDAIRGANILLQEGVEGWDKFKDTMAGAPSVAEQSARRLNTLQGRIEQLKGSLETIAIQVGTVFLPILTKVADKAVTFVNDLMTLHPDQIFNAMLPPLSAIKDLAEPAFGPIQQFMSFLGDHSEILVGAAIGIGVIAAALAAYTLAQGIATTALGLFFTTVEVEGEALLVSNPIGWIVLAAAAAGAAIFLLIKNWDDIIDRFPIVGKVSAELKDKFLLVVDAIMAVGSAVKEWIGDNWHAIWDVAAKVVRPFISLFVDEFKTIVNMVRDVFNIVIGLVHGDWSKVWDSAKQLVIDYVQGVADRIGNLKDIFLGLISIFVDDIAPKLWAALKLGFEVAWQWISDNVPSWPGKIWEFLSFLDEKLDQFKALLWDLLVRGFEAAWQWISDNVPTWPGKVWDFLQEMAPKVKAVFELAGNAIKDGLLLGWNWMADNLPGWAGKVWAFLKDLPDKVCEIAKAAGNGLLGALSSAWQWITDTLPTWPAKIWSALKAIITFMCEVGKRAGSGFVSFLGSALTALKGPLQWIIDRFGDFVDAINDILGKIHAPQLPKPGGLGGGDAPSVTVDTGTGAPAAEAGVSLTPTPVPDLHCFAMGGEILRPMLAMMGEDAPRYPEHVISTNPRYRTSALGHWISAGKALGIDGPMGGPFDKLGGIVSAIGDVGEWIQEGARALIEKAINALGLDFSGVTGMVKDMAVGTLSYLKDNMLDFVQGALDKEKETQSTFAPPLRSYVVTQEFGANPDLYGPGGHTGIDLAGVPIGTDILASAGGRVASAGINGGFGNAVILNHLNSLQTLYGHMNSIAARIDEQPARGSVLGGVGWTGHVIPEGPQGAHLHFEMRSGGVPFNPRGMVMLARGGRITEPVIGFGLRTGKTYSLGEQSDELVLPLGTGGDTTNAGSSTPIPVMIMGIGGVSVSPITTSTHTEATGAAGQKQTIDVETTLNYLSLFGLILTKVTDEFGTFFDVSKTPGLNIAAPDQSGQQLADLIGRLPEANRKAFVEAMSESALWATAAANVQSAFNVDSPAFQAILARVRSENPNATEDVIRMLANQESLLAANSTNAAQGAQAAAEAAAQATQGANTQQVQFSDQQKQNFNALQGLLERNHQEQQELHAAQEFYQGLIQGGGPLAQWAQGMLDTANDRVTALLDADQRARDAQNAVLDGNTAAINTFNQQAVVLSGQTQQQVDEQSDTTDRNKEIIDNFGDHVDKMGNVVDELGGHITEVSTYSDAALAAARERWRKENPGKEPPFARGGKIPVYSYLMNASTGEIYGTAGENGGESWIISNADSRAAAVSAYSMGQNGRYGGDRAAGTTIYQVPPNPRSIVRLDEQRREAMRVRETVRSGR